MIQLDFNTTFGGGKVEGVLGVASAFNSFILKVDVATSMVLNIFVQESSLTVNNVPNSYLIPERYGLMDGDLIFKRAFNFLNFQLCFSQVHLLCRACYFYIIKFFVLPFKLFPTKKLKYTVFSPFLCFLITVDRTALFQGILLLTFNECF